MKWSEIDQLPCSLARTLSVIGDRWTMLIIRNCFLGVRRFDDFQRQLGITRHLLASRLKKLVEEEVLRKVPYGDGGGRFEYRLTAKGMDLYPIVMTMVDWGNRWMSDPDGPPLRHIHQTCERPFRPVLTCSECGEAIDPRQVSVEPGEAFRDLLATLEQDESIRG